MWILIPSYITDCCSARKWLREENYELSSITAELIGHSAEDELVRAPTYWRDQRKASNDCGPFSGWVVAVVVKDRGQSDVYTRFVIPVLVCSSSLSVEHCWYSTCFNKSLNDNSYYFHSSRLMEWHFSA